MGDYRLIDAHQHCWQVADVSWPTAGLPTIYRDFTPRDFIQASGGQVGSVLVQSQPTEADTDYLLSLASQHSHILGVVGWTDLAAPGAPEIIARRVRHPAFCGLRPMLQNLQEDDWIVRDSVQAGLQALERHQLCFDALVFPHHLPYIEQVAERYPSLAIVLDHAAKPDIASGQWRDWYEAMARLAARPNVHCKLSGLITEASPGASLAVTGRYLEAVLALFGRDRVLWGSDWPVLNLEANYSDWLTYCQEQVKRTDSEAMAGVFCDNAKRFYRLT